MGMSHVEDRLYSIEEVEALQDADPAQRYELVDGELHVSPSPIPVHQMAVSRLHLALSAYVDAQLLGEVLMSPADIRGGPRTMLQPDLFVLRLPPTGLPQRWADAERPILAVEVLSPSTAAFDRMRKRPAYQAMGAEYWIVDADARQVARWTPTADIGEIHVARISWHPEGATEPFVLDLPDFFARVHREPQ